jgi:hypothetical protein
MKLSVSFNVEMPDTMLGVVYRDAVARAVVIAVTSVRRAGFRVSDLKTTFTELDGVPDVASTRKAS